MAINRRLKSIFPPPLEGVVGFGAMVLRVAVWLVTGFKLDSTEVILESLVTTLDGTRDPLEARPEVIDPTTDVPVGMGTVVTGAVVISALTVVGMVSGAGAVSVDLTSVVVTAEAAVGVAGGIGTEVIGVTVPVMTMLGLVVRQ